MLKKGIKKLGLLLITITVFSGSFTLIKAAGDTLSPIEMPTQKSASLDGKFRVTETQQWMDNNYEEGLINFRLERDVEMTSMQDNLDVVYLIDSSSSMGGDRSRNLQLALVNTASYFLSSGLNNRVNCVFMDDLAIRYNFESDSTSFGDTVRKMNGIGTTNLEAGFEQVYTAFSSRTDKSRKPTVIMITDGGGTDSVGLQTYQTKVKELGAEIHVIQYMDGETVSPLLSGLASNSSNTHVVTKLQDISDSLTTITTDILDTVTYNDVKLEFHVKDENFSINDMSADVGKITQSDNLLIWSIPQLISGKDVNLRVKVKLKHSSLKGNLLVHEDTDSISYTKSNEGLPAIPIPLKSTTLTRKAYTIHFDGGGATQGSAPADIEVVGKGIIEIPDHAGTLINGNAIFRGWQKPDNSIVNGKIGKPQTDLTLTATWGNVEIEMNTDTNESIRTIEINKPGEVIVDSAIWNATSKIEFVNYVDPAATIDLSKVSDDSVKAWMGTDATADTLFIGSNDYILAPMDNSSFFGSSRANIKSINFNNRMRFQNDSSAKEMFLNYSILETVSGMSNTSGINDMNAMFKGCRKLIQIEDFKNFKTSLVTDISEMFMGCSNIAIIDFSNWDTKKLKKMDYVFYSCMGLEKIDFTNFNTENVTSMTNFFLDANSLEELDLSSFNTHNVTNMENMLANAAIERLTLGEFDTSKVTDMSGMFSSIFIEELDLSSFNTSNVTNMREMFSSMYNLKYLDISNFDINTTTNISFLLNNSSALTTVYVKDEATAIRIKNDGRPSGTVDIKTKTTRSTLNETVDEYTAKEAVLKKVSATSYMGFNHQMMSAIKSVVGTIDGGQIKPNAIVKYSIKTKFDAASDLNSSGIIKISNPLPKDMTLDTTSIENKGVSRIVDGDGGGVNGEIYNLKTENNVITYEVRGLSPGAQLTLAYQASAPAEPTNTYKEFLNQSTANTEGLSLTSNYVRHYFATDPVASVKHNLSYVYDASVPAGAPILPEAWDYIKDQEVLLPELTMPGYTFNGWNLPDGGKVTNPFLMIDSNLVLTGSWTVIPADEKVKSKVIFVSSGKEPVVDLPSEEEYVVGTKYAIIGKEVIIPDALSADGYDFLGWESDSLTQADIDKGSFLLGKDDVTLTAKWAKKKYEVTYTYSKITPDAPALPGPASVEWGTEVMTIGKETMAGFAFDGWYTNNDLGSQYQTKFIMPKEDVTLYAGWTDIPYDIHYEYEGDIPEDAQDLGKTKSVKDVTVNTWLKPSSTATTDKNGTFGTWTFDGWKSEDVTITADQFIMPSKKITIKGTWTFSKNLNIRFVDFKIKNGTWADGSQVDKRVIVELDDVTKKTSLLEKDIPKNMIPHNEYTDGKWIVTPDVGIDMISDSVTYTYQFVKKPLVTFIVENGTWANGKAIQIVDLDMLNGKATLLNIPHDMVANIGYENGKWDIIPNTEIGKVTGDITYTYRYVKKQYDIPIQDVHNDIEKIVQDMEYGKTITLRDISDTMLGQFTVNDDIHTIVLPEKEGKKIIDFVIAKDDDGNVIVTVIYADIEGSGTNTADKISTGDTTQWNVLCLLMSTSFGVLYFNFKKRKQNW